MNLNEYENFFYILTKKFWYSELRAEEKNEQESFSCIDSLPEVVFHNFSDGVK